MTELHYGLAVIDDNDSDPHLALGKGCAVNRQHCRHPIPKETLILSSTAIHYDSRSWISYCTDLWCNLHRKERKCMRADVRVNESKFSVRGK